ncbi:hypothetical protein H6P81_002720 [Aristolochia fimbriata]|uniref:Putative plant transposon protein domain-containing protein n=1 Tax=Aristolochia fimbriata TaxID=158543 RepID=A0AAV7FAJ0_ARIFI|nr:hypothetical protein H6P81_002720 [Aristolochia fimbriata]
MGPKRKKGKKVWDRSVFSYEKSYEMYTKGILMNKPIPERGLDNWELDPLYKRQIQNRNWGTFCAQPKGAIITLVREFYANANVARRPECTVRGKTIAYDPCIINVVYQTPWEGQDDYSTLKDRVTPEEVGAFLCPNGTTWKRCFYYLSLITSLCNLAGVEFSPMEEISYAASPINVGFIKLVSRQSRPAAQPMPCPLSMEEQLTQLWQLVDCQGRYMSEMLQSIAQKQGMTSDDILPYTLGQEGTSVRDALMEEAEGSEGNWLEGE